MILCLKMAKVVSIVSLSNDTMYTRYMCRWHILCAFHGCINLWKKSFHSNNGRKAESSRDGEQEKSILQEE